MKIYRYAKKQYIKMTEQERAELAELMECATIFSPRGYMKNPINGLDLDLSKLNFNVCIGCGWLQVLLMGLDYRKTRNLKWGYNTYFKEA